MGESNNGKPKRNSAKKDWTEKIREEARQFYQRGIELVSISEQLGVPYELLTSWKFMEQWDNLPDNLIIGEDNFPTSIEKTVDVQLVQESIYDMDSNKLANDANERLLAGYKLIGSVAQEAVLNENIKFKDKKQASDALIDSLKGEVAILGADLSQQFLLDVAQIIREEITDQETLQRLGTKLTALGRLYNTRIAAQG
jgi:uncharacterized protein YjcR